MQKYSPKEIEQKWQKRWEEQGLYRAEDDSSKPKFYVLDMFPYPSGSGLHVGHVEGYTATDIYCRFKRMQGYNVLHAMGWDAFGLPAENYAVKTGIHPKKTTEDAISAFRRQIKELGLSYDWTREIGAHTPQYYKWTQWFFLLLYKNGLAYKAKANVNWCPWCQTVLANEQVINGKCERCESQVNQKELEQWFFKITDFADALIDDLDKVDWPESTIRNQRNWIGRSEGATLKFEIRNPKSETNSKFQIPNSKQYVEVFTTRPDTLFGATYMVLAPEHPLVDQLKPQISNWKKVQAYRKKAEKKSELERAELGKEKTGVELKGVKAVNPGSKEKIPVFIADYVLASYGTGAIMAVPAHDERDWEFAQKRNLPIVMVVCPHYPAKTCPVMDKAYLGEGHVVVSGKFNGMPNEKAKREITKFVKGKRTIKYHLRDWLVSRQRYWGAPIPIVYDPDGQPHPIPEEHLPWLLPTDVEFKPTGTSPLAQSKELKDRTEKLFGKGWIPEADTMDTFVCSSWYYFRFADPRNNKEFASKQAIQAWLPVDLYMGGAEHTVLHLMYARFFTKALYKLGHIDFDEPFLMLRHQGTILGPDNQKMSKSRGNVITPDEVVAKHGADTVRMYEMFLGPLADSKPWDPKSIAGIRRFLEKVWNFAAKPSLAAAKLGLANEALRHKTIKKVTEDLEELRYNTAIAALMEYFNECQKSKVKSQKSIETLLILLAPFAPHLTEELWQQLQNVSGFRFQVSGSVHNQPWPKYDPRALQEKQVRLVVQVNGKVREVLEVAPGISEKEAVALALKQEKIKKWFPRGKPKNAVFVKGRLLNLVSY